MPCEASAIFTLVMHSVTSFPPPLNRDPSQRALRDALGMFATGVTIVTTLAPDGSPVGLTVNSFNSVSLAPPLVLWSLARRAASFDLFMQAGHYAINVLTVRQHALALRFAQRDADRWAGVDWHPGKSGMPVLAGAAAVFECASRSQYSEGDHTILVGEVLHSEHHAHSSPLLYHGSRFYTEHALGATDAAPAKAAP